MAINIFALYGPIRAGAPTVDYPVGFIKNESVPGANDGTPLDQQWANDYAGFDAALLAEAGLTASGSPDTANSSQRLDAIKQIINKNAEEVVDADFEEKTGLIDISDLGTSSDNRAYIYGLGSDVFIRPGAQVRCNLLPNDDVTIFKGEGQVLSLDPWGNEQVFDVYKANNGDGHTTQSRIRSKALIGEQPTIGFVGDSITDGADSAGWTPNPTDGNGNLNSTNYNHDQVGAPNAYVNIFRLFSYAALGTPSAGRVETYNCSSSGKALYTEWAYRNIDYGFFQNAAYGNAAPDVIFLVMGHNDAIPSEAGNEKYLNEFDKFIKKARGYGAAVGLITVSRNAVDNGQKETFKEAVKTRYGIDYFDLARPIIEYARNGASTLKDLYFDGPGLTDYDFTHPNTNGHKFMGLELLGQIFPDRVIDLDNDGGYTPMRTAKQITYEVGGALQNVTTTEDLTGQDYLAEVEGLTSHTVVGGSGVVHASIIRVRNPLQKIAAVIPKPPSDETSYQIEIDNASKSAIDNIYSTGGDSIDAYYAISLENADYGINVVRTIAQGPTAKSFVPFYAPVPSDNIQSVSILRNVLADNSRQKITGVNFDKAFHRAAYSTMPDGATPDRIIGVAQNTRVQVAIPALVGLRFWLAFKGDISANNGWRVQLSSPTQLDIVDGETSTVVSSITGLSLSGRLVFDAVYTGNTFVVQCQGNQSSPSLIRRGGTFHIENQTGSDIIDFEGSVTVSKEIVK